ncbi:MAG: long-chain fatty acid--CoA ligase [Spirochaetales bacterium]|nr:long-chain fatty acid--CoA ligase [Spirochaetales bacterium]
MHEQLKVLPDAMYYIYNKFPNRPFLKYRNEEKVYTPITFAEYTHKVEALSASLDSIGVKKGDKVAIISDNNYKWLITDMAILTLGAADVPRGSDSTDVELEYILDHSDAEYCFIETIALAERVIPILTKINRYKTVILMFGNTDEIKADKGNLTILNWDKMQEEGVALYEQNKAKFEQIRASLTEDDLATLIYTSGTTGMPKGVMLLHKNLMHQVRSLPDIMPCHEKDRWLSVLPIWHVFERAVEYCVLVTGSCMGYSKPSPRNLLPDINEIKPSFMISVPRIWEAVYSGVMAQVKKGPAAALKIFNFFLNIALLYNKQKRIICFRNPQFTRRKMPLLIPIYLKALLFFLLLWIPNALGQLIVFSKIRGKIGGKLKAPISGGGALPEYIDNFFSAIGINILEGYGLTETSPVISVRHIHHPVSRSVGKPYHDIDVYIGDNNFRRHHNQHRKGTLYVKGDLVMAGYYKDPERTAEVLRDGWFNTGDLARLSLNGYIQLMGRAKDTIVLVGGENIEPGPIEERLCESELINQVMVVGQDKKTLGAIIVPAQSALETFAKQNNIQYNEYKELMTNDKVIAEITDIIKHKINKHNGFRAYETVPFFFLLDEPFVVGKELTASLKMKRNVIAKKYAEQIEALYK